VGLRSISFLAADLTSTAFNRPEGWTPDRQSEISLDGDEIRTLDREIDALIATNQDGFILESPEKTPPPSRITIARTLDWRNPMPRGAMPRGSRPLLNPTAQFDPASSTSLSAASRNNRCSKFVTGPARPSNSATR